MFQEEYCYDTLEKTVGELYYAVRQIADSNGTILIQGKSGTGKEAICNLLCRGDVYRKRPVIAINCAAIPESLMESELFGFEPGAFTGAEHQQQGKFELAGDGTLILDEISEMSVAMQAKLLRVLEAREFYRLGGNAPIRVQARIIATTNRRLSDCVRAGTFREDLFYRLDVLRLEVPTLAERSRDIPLLVDHFLSQLIKGTSRRIRLSPEVYYFLCQKVWEGNIRELKNFVTRMFYLAEGEVVTIHDLGEHPLGASRSENVTLPFFSIGNNLSLEEMEKKYILQTLNVSKGNKSQAARMLQISLKTLRNKLKEYQGQISAH